MARVFPRPFPPAAAADPFRGAERKVYGLLQDQLPEDFTVFYSVAWLGRPASGGPVDGDADFVVVHPEHGIMILEVKGGGISRDGASGRWFSTDRRGTPHPIADPFDQSRRSKYALLGKIKDLPGLRDRWLDAGHGVVLPDSRRSSPFWGPDVAPEIVAFSDDLPRLGDWVREAFRYWGGKREGEVLGATEGGGNRS